MSAMGALSKKKKTHARSHICYRTIFQFLEHRVLYPDQTSSLD